MYVAKMVDDALLPTRKHPMDAGMDFYSYGDHIIKPHTFKLVGTGILVSIPYGCYGQLFPKGRNNWLIGSGVVDYGYQGEVIIKVVNPYDYDIVIRHGDPVCQMVIIKIATPYIIEMSADAIFSEVSDRGNSGGILFDTESE